MATKYQSIDRESSPQKPQHNPLDHANIFSRITYSWANKLMALGNQRQLELHDIWPLREISKTEIVARQYLPKYYQSKSIVKAWLSVFGCQTVMIGLMQLIVMGCSLYGPVVLQQVVSGVESTNIDMKSLMLAVVSLFAVKVVQAIIQTQSDLQNELLSVRATAALQDLLYKKALALNVKSRKIKSTGEVSNLFGADMMWILSVSSSANEIWIIPTQIIALFYMLWRILGYAIILGIGVMLLVLQLNRLVAERMRGNWQAAMEKEDQRMKIVNEVFGSMQIVKLNAWEERYYKAFKKIREQEMGFLRREIFMIAISSTINNIGPVLLTTISFGSYVLLLGETLTAAKVFTALSLFAMIRTPIVRLPFIITNWMQATVALNRFHEFLSLEEKRNDLVSSATSSNDIAIEIINGTFGYDADKPLFSNVNLTIRHGEFVVLHGTVGEGKSSLCNALLGEIGKYNGTVAVNG
ncbi:ATP-binding Cassette (ABC) Superfamily, partial [Thraustotheca clavata]